MLEIDLPLVILTAVVFLGLIFILNSVLYKPLLGFIDARNNAIKIDEDSTSRNASDLALYESEIEKILSAARSEAGKIRQDAINLAKDSASKLISEKKAILEADYNLFIQNLQSNKDELSENLYSKLPEFRSALKSKLSRI
ncbi:MAG: FoF1 ATP synthase subunit B' [Campylobacter sp.]